MANNFPQQRPATAECRPKGGINKRTRSSPSFINTLKQTLKEQWEQSEPKWFITIQWNPAPSSFQTASAHSRLFRNKLLCGIYNCHLNQLPEPQDRTRLFWFQERALDPQGRLIYHSHLHLTQLPALYAAQRQLELLILGKVAPKFKCLKNLYRKRDPAVVIKNWNPKHHANYNFKDYFTYRDRQDSDLVLDIEISDLIFAK